MWPNDQTDQLENILYEQSGFLSSSALFTVEGCTGIGTGGRIIGAEWLRLVFRCTLVGIAKWAWPSRLRLPKPTNLALIHMISNTDCS